MAGSRRKACKICHVVTDLDKDGRCAFCKLCYDAVEAGTSYGKYVAAKAQEGEELPERPMLIAVGNQRIIACPVCGKQFIRTNITRKYCCKTCSAIGTQMARDRYNESLKTGKGDQK